jgi:hypothetical protein
MSYMDWKAGDKVVCIRRGTERMAVDTAMNRASSKVGRHTDPRVVFFADLRVRPFCEESIRSANTATPRWQRASFGASRFRPVQTRKTSIEVFERLLTPSEHDKHLIEVHDFVSLQEPFQ